MPSLFVFSWRICLFLALTSTVTDSFVVTNTASPVMTRTGCKVVLTCGGFGERIEWKQFGDVDPLQDNNNQSTRTHSVEVENMSVPYLISNATLTAYPAIDNERFQCFIYGSLPEGRTISHQVLLRVKPQVVAIEPAIKSKINISEDRIGDPLTIGCPVQTCAEEVTVQFLKGDEIVKEINAKHPTDNTYDFSQTISADVVGMYACKVSTVNPDSGALQIFEVVGTPMPALSTPSPTDSTTEGGTQPTSSNGDGGDDGNDSALVLSLPSLTVLLLSTALLHWL